MGQKLMKTQASLLWNGVNVPWKAEGTENTWNATDTDLACTHKIINGMASNGS